MSYYTIQITEKFFVQGKIERIIFPHDWDAFINIWKKCRISK